MVMCEFKWGWLGSVLTVVGGLGYGFRWMGRRWVGFSGLAYEFQLMVKSFKPCTTIEVVAISLLLYFVFSLFFFCSFLFFFGSCL